MHKTIVSALGAAIFSAGAALFGPAPLGAQTSVSASPPDFSGVYYPVQQGRGGQGRRAGAPPNTPPGAPPDAARRGGPPPRPTQSAPLSDGSQGRAPDAPSLTPEYMAKWEMMRKSRIAGSYEFDNTAKCLPPGMPAMMNMAYGMEVMQTKDKITFFSELNDALRRVYLTGVSRRRILEDPPTRLFDRTLEADTLVVDTQALHGSSIEGFTPHSKDDGEGADRFTGPDVLERSNHGHRSASARSRGTGNLPQAMFGNDELRDLRAPRG